MANLKQKVLKIVSGIPRGKVTTYGQIAKVLGLKDARVIGWMLHQNKDPNVPCHRVIKSDGTVAKGYAFGGANKQQKMLQKDGIVFKKTKVVDLVKYLYNTILQDQV